MFAVNDYVFYGSGGVCKIVDIQTAPLESMPRDKQYYIMHSLHDASSVMYIPVDSDCIFLRPLISRTEAEELLAQIPYVTPLEAPNAKQLRECYAEAMRRHMPIDWVRVIKTVWLRMNEPRPAARRISETERSFAENARKYLYTELSLVLDVSAAKMEEYIAASVNNAIL
ncbi:MAG: hypothetical protein IJW16_03565 [Clostridia bacterium]|nr:hypothetical protein [Clostridia bacterium]